MWRSLPYVWLEQPKGQNKKESINVGFFIFPSKKCQGKAATKVDQGLP
jgi:hypothetical protein